jgi:hypothetical protein
MLKMVKGAKIAGADKLEQGYQIMEDRIVASVDADNIRNVINGFLDINEGLPLFMFFEIPTNLKDEEIARKNEDGSLVIETHHKDVYYLDGISAEFIRMIPDEIYDVIINDGISSFGVGNPLGEEIGKYRYNQMMVFTKEPKRYAEMLDKAGVKHMEDLVSAWNTITSETPGTCELYKAEDGKNIYDVIRAFTDIGLYKAEKREG